MAKIDAQQSNMQVFTLVLVVVCVAALYLAKEVLIPLAMATLLTFILAPLVDRLERIGLGRVPSIAVVVLAALMVIGSVTYLVAEEFIDLSNNLPTYQRTIVRKVNELKFSTSGPLAKVQRAVRELSNEISRPSSPPAEPGGHGEVSSPGLAPAPEVERPMPVEIVEPAGSSISFFGNLLSGVFGGLATVGVVTLFLVFMLASREDLHNRLIRLIGADQITVTTQALDDAGRRVSRYLRMQLIINASFGLMLAIGLYLIGLPNALLWGLVAGLLRYIPYLGAWLGAAVAVAISLAVFDGWTQPLMVLGLFAVAELLTGNLLEPVLFHTSTGISTIGILVAAVFWTWLWGGVGLVLSTPLTVCIAVLGRYVPQLEFFNVLLSDEAVLDPGARFYHRLLVGDLDGARALVEVSVKGKSITDLLEEMLMPALALATQDAYRGNLNPEKRDFIFENIREVLDELVGLEPAVEPPAAGHPAVVCVPARDAADEIAATMLQQRLIARGITAELLSSKVLVSELVDQIAELSPNVVFISAVPPFAGRYASNLCKRLRSRNPNLRIFVAIWGDSSHQRSSEQRLRGAGAQKVVTTLSEALELVERHVPAVSKTATDAPLVPVEPIGQGGSI